MPSHWLKLCLFQCHNTTYVGCTKRAPAKAFLILFFKKSVNYRILIKLSVLKALKMRLIFKNVFLKILKTCFFTFFVLIAKYNLMNIVITIKIFVAI